MAIKFDRATGKFVGIDENVRKQLSISYADKNIDEEFRKMSVWLQSSKGKNIVGTLPFITRWLERAHVNPVYIEKASKSPEKMQTYLEELWKNCNHLFEFNQIRA